MRTNSHQTSTISDPQPLPNHQSKSNEKNKKRNQFYRFWPLAAKETAVEGGNSRGKRTKGSRLGGMSWGAAGGSEIRILGHEMGENEKYL